MPWRSDIPHKQQARGGYPGLQEMMAFSLKDRDYSPASTNLFTIHIEKHVFFSQTPRAHPTVKFVTTRLASQSTNNTGLEKGQINQSIDIVR